jgi:putative membrane protein
MDGMPGFWLDGGFGILALVSVVLGLVFWGLVLAGLFFGVRWLIRQDRNSRLPPSTPPLPPVPPDASAGHGTGPKHEDPLEILRQRYARGEIDEDEYQRRRTTLSGG